MQKFTYVKMDRQKVKVKVLFTGKYNSDYVFFSLQVFFFSLQVLLINNKQVILLHRNKHKMKSFFKLRFFFFIIFTLIEDLL